MTKKTLAVTALAGVLLVGGTTVALAQWWGGWGMGPKDKPAQAQQAAAPTDATAEVILPAQSYDLQGLRTDPLKIQNFDRVIGSMSAPVTMIEYASMTCSHCADFHNGVVPQVIKEYVETGKVKYVLRDLPWDNLALGISKVTRCAEAKEFYPLVTAFFNAQKDIVTSGNPKGEIVKVARLAGFDEARVNACVKDEPLHGLVLAMKESGLSGLGIKGTPTSFVNGTKIDGGLPWAEVKAVIDAELAKAGAQ